MTKDEILEKSRKAGKGVPDERELLIVQKSKAVSQAVSLTVCMLLSLFCMVTDGPMLISNTAWTITAAMYATDNLFLAIKLNKPLYCVLGVIWVLAFFAYLRVLGNAFV